MILMRMKVAPQKTDQASRLNIKKSKEKKLLIIEKKLRKDQKRKK